MTVIACAMLSACGGGGGDAATAPTTTVTTATAEGVYGGTMTGSTYTAFNMLVLENGDFWSLYGTQGTSNFGVAGFVQGTATSSNSTFTSANAKDFGYAPGLAGTVSATYNATAKTISGTAIAGTSSTSFSGGPIAGSLYDYNAAPSLTTLQGAWSTTSMTGESVALTVAANGTYTAVSGLGCQFSGTFAPRTSGKNVFNVTMTFGAAPCALPNQLATGIALAYPITGGKTQLLIAAVDSTRTYGAAALGTR